MASSTDRKWLFGGLIATALSTALYWFGTGLQLHAWLTWLAPSPIALLAPYVRARWIALAALVAGALACSRACRASVWRSAKIWIFKTSATHMLRATHSCS